MTLGVRLLLMLLYVPTLLLLRVRVIDKPTMPAYSNCCFVPSGGIEHMPYVSLKVYPQ